MLGANAGYASTSLIILSAADAFDDVAGDEEEEAGAREQEGWHAGQTLLLSDDDGDEDHEGAYEGLNGQRNLSTGPSQPRPRFCWVLALLAAIDFVITAFLGAQLLYEQPQRHGSNPDSKPPTGEDGSNSGGGSNDEDRRLGLIAAMIACAVLRDTVLGAVAFSKQVRQLAITVAAVALASLLFVTAVFNLLFQARAAAAAQRAVGADASTISSEGIVKIIFGPQLDLGGAFSPITAIPLPQGVALLATVNLAMTLLQWITYIAIVGIRPPPGGNPVQARRWIQALHKGELDIDAGGQTGASPRIFAVEGEEGMEFYEEVSYSDEDGEQGEAYAQDDGGGELPTDDELEYLEDAHGDGLQSSPERLTPDAAVPIASAPGSSPILRPRTSHHSLRSQHSSSQTQTAAAGSNSSTSPAAHTPLLLAPHSAPSSRSHSYSPSSPHRLLLHAHSAEEEEAAEEDREFSTSRLLQAGAARLDAHTQGDDPDDILDITPDRRVARRISRRRLALAADPERRKSRAGRAKLTPGAALGFAGGAGGGAGGQSWRELGSATWRSARSFALRDEDDSRVDESYGEGGLEGDEEDDDRPRRRTYRVRKSSQRIKPVHSGEAHRQDEARRSRTLSALSARSNRSTYGTFADGER